jgi:hypothetical protein
LWPFRKTWTEYYVVSLFHPEMKHNAIILSLPTGNMLALQNMYMFALELWVSYFVYLSVCQATNERFVSHCFNDFFIHAPKKKKNLRADDVVQWTTLGDVHKLLWQVFGFFWPPTPLRWHFLPYKTWHFWTTSPPLLLNVVCELRM